MDPLPPPPASDRPAPDPDRTRRVRQPDSRVWRGAGIAFLVGQGLLLGWLCLRPASLMRLTPLEGETEYHVHVVRDGVELGPAAVRNRYGIPPSGRVALATEGLRAIVRARESGPGADGRTTVRLHTSAKPGDWNIWLWPEQ